MYPVIFDKPGVWHRKPGGCIFYRAALRICLRYYSNFIFLTNLNAKDRPGGNLGPITSNARRRRHNDQRQPLPTKQFFLQD